MVEATSTGLLSYQWLRSDVPISGATSRVYVTNSTGLPASAFLDTKDDPEGKGEVLMDRP